MPVMVLIYVPEVGANKIVSSDQEITQNAKIV
jgi:hypothetical protein